MKPSFAFIVFCILCFGLFSDLSARTWTVQGEQFEGDCLKCPSESLVEILTEDDTIVVPLEWLSTEDRDFLAEHFPYKPAEAEEAPQNPVSGESPDFWRIAEHALSGILLLGFVILLFQEGRSLGSKSSKDPEMEAAPRAKNKETEGLAFIGPVLSGERFGYDSELEKEAEKQASRWADAVVLELDGKLDDSKHPSVERIQKMAQNIADDINKDFTREICAPNSFWTRKIYGENAEVPSDLAGIVDNLLSPIQVPAARQVRLDVSPFAIGITAVVGALLGALSLCFCANVCGMKEPGDVSVLLGAVLGTGLFSALLVRIAADEGIRKWLERVLFGVIVADTALTLVGFFTSFGKFFGKSKKIDGSFLKRLGLWFGSILLLKLMKREIVFDRDDYKNKIEMLFRERIQSVVMILALYKTEKDYIVSEQENWAKKEEELEARIKGNSTVMDSMKSLVPKMKEFQKARISDIVRSAKVLLQEFRLIGFDIPKESVYWESELNDLLKESGISPASSEPSRPIRRTFEWSEEKRGEYTVFGDPDEGEEVQVLEEPVFQNGKVFKQGIVQEIPESN